MRLQPGDIARTLAASQRLEPLPLIVYQTREPFAADHWRSVSDRLTVWPVQTEAELQDHAALVLHRSVEQLPDAQKQSVMHLRKIDTPLEGKKVLIVDDDMRNIFALAALLEEHGMEITSADNGREALDILNNRSDLDVVLMDIMMPEMDGYETMQRIRKDARYRRLPIIALTAKAMQGDREKCLEAGASDYIAKPVNTNQLLSLVRMWLHP